MAVLCNWAIREDLSVFTSFFQRLFIPSAEHLDGRNLPCHVVQPLPQHFISLSHWFKLVDSRYLSRLLLNSSVQSLLTCPQQSMAFWCLVCWKAFPKGYSEYPPAAQSHGLSCTYWTWRTSKLLPLASLLFFFNSKDPASGTVTTVSAPVWSYCCAVALQALGWECKLLVTWVAATVPQEAAEIWA